MMTMIMKMKKIFSIILSVCCLAGGLGLVSCSDEPDTSNYYTFKGEMMSDYINNRPEYSDFAYIIKQAGLMDVLSAYGHYTCFLPSNTVMDTYLKKHGLSSVEQLTKGQCDTIARSHLVNNMYATIDMNDGTLNTENLNKRFIQITHGLDKDSNTVVELNRMAYIYNATKDDSVQNGIVQPISAVLENSNSSIADILTANDKISMFVEALKATGLQDSLYKVKDTSYDPDKYGYYTYTSDFWHEIACPPADKKYGYTVFVEKDSLLKAKLSAYGISTANGNLQALYDLACKLYDPVYGTDADYQADKGMDKITKRMNPLNMFIAYHILTRDVIGWNKLTPLEYSWTKPTANTAIGIKVDLMDPTDWYETMLPHTMMKLDQATIGGKTKQGSDYGQRFINRRQDSYSRYKDNDLIRGAKVLPTVEDQYTQDAPNGRYFYIDDIIAFDETTQMKVFNDRIRMDFSTIFPQVMTENIRLNGDPAKDDNSAKADQTFANGKNYWFPTGYLDHVTMRGGYLVYRRPHRNFWSYEGDEWNLFGDYDISFRLPPVPYEGEYQIRLGFCALKTRGVAQVYFDNRPQGIPLDMRKFLDDETILGSKFTTDWAKLSSEEKAEDQKMLRNLGRYRGAYGGYHTDGNAINEFVNNPRTHRIVLCTVHIDPKSDHYLRIRCTSTSKLGNNNEFMLDYLEIVPKSIYSVGAGQMETDL